MSLLRGIRDERLVAPVLALLLASFVFTLLVAYHIVVGSQVRHAYLIWNLFLAWVPLAFALLAVERWAATWQAGKPTPDPAQEGNRPLDARGPEVPLLGGGRGGSPGTSARLLDRKFLALSAGWLLFFPNSPYIFTDLVHVLATWRQTFWSELMLILLAAMTGFLAGFLSLQVMHRLVTRAWGRARGWLFVAVVSGLGAFGVYLGRFVRLNSWDVLVNPVALVKHTSIAALNLATQWQHTKFLILFSLFLLLGYVMLFALTQAGVTRRDNKKCGRIA